MLLYAARNQQNPGVRVESVDLLSRKCDKQQIRELMMYALRYDANPGVRLKALDGGWQLSLVPLRDYASLNKLPDCGAPTFRR